MTFENNFINHSKEYIFFDNKTLLNQREEAFKKISQKNYDRKNNEMISKQAGLAYPIRDGIPIMLEEEARKIKDNS